jgi:glycosyltransferase involved in cell wall biosynthesis
MIRRHSRPPRRPGALFVVNHASYFLSHRLPLAQALREAGFAVGVVAADHPDRPRIERLGYTFDAWSMSRGGTNPVREAESIRQLIRIYRRRRPLLVHQVTSKPVIYGAIAASIVGVPAVINALTGLGYVFSAEHRREFRSRIAALLHRVSHRDRSRTIFQNPEDLGLFIERRIVDPSRAVLIRGSGVDPSAYLPAPSPAEAPVVVVPARMLTDKGIVEAVEAAAILRSRGVACELWLAGGADPDSRTAVSEQRLRGWHESGAARWLGHVDDMVGVYQRARIACLPTYREGLPRALIEAASCGLPIVATDIPGCRETVRHGVTGLLVPPRDAGAVADALQRLLTDPTLGREFGRRGRELVIGSLTVERVVAATVDVYRDALGPLWPGGTRPHGIGTLINAR